MEKMLVGMDIVNLRNGQPEKRSRFSCVVVLWGFFFLNYDLVD